MGEASAELAPDRPHRRDEEHREVAGPEWLAEATAWTVRRQGQQPLNHQHLHEPPLCRRLRVPRPPLRVHLSAIQIGSRHDRRHPDRRAGREVGGKAGEPGCKHHAAGAARRTDAQVTVGRWGIVSRLALRHQIRRTPHLLSGWRAGSPRAAHQTRPRPEHRRADVPSDTPSSGGRDHNEPRPAAEAADCVSRVGEADVAATRRTDASFQRRRAGGTRTYRCGETSRLIELDDGTLGSTRTDLDRLHVPDPTGAEG